MEKVKVLNHDYGKGTVSRATIRSVVKSVVSGKFVSTQKSDPKGQYGSKNQSGSHSTRKK